MRKVKIIADSTIDLNPETIKEFGIEIVPLFVNFEDKSYQDGVDITTRTLYDLVDEKKVLPKTSAVSVGTFVDIFEKNINDGYDIIYTGISASMSSSHNNAILAKQMVDETNEHIYIVDSKNLSSGIGLIILKAAKLAQKGISAKEIVSEMERIIPLVRSQFVIEKMDYLYKGGRCSSLAMIFGTVLKIKPLIAVRDGKMTVYKKPRGNMLKGLDALLNVIAADKDNLDGDVIMITHSLGEKYVPYLEEGIKNLNIKTKEVMITEAGCVISSHCGKGTIGILYILNK